jgi:hypothetical protein
MREADAWEQIQTIEQGMKLIHEMNWKDMTTQQKNRFIAEALFGHEIYAAFAPGSETELDYGMFVSDARGVRRIEAIPPYSTSMDAAWQVLQALKEQEKRLPEREKHHLSSAFMQALDTHWHDDWGLPVLGFWNLVHLTPERICYAACRAIGVLDAEGNVQEKETV